MAFDAASPVSLRQHKVLELFVAHLICAANTDARSERHRSYSCRTPTKQDEAPEQPTRYAKRGPSECDVDHVIPLLVYMDLGPFLLRHVARKLVTPSHLPRALVCKRSKQASHSGGCSYNSSLHLVEGPRVRIKCPQGSHQNVHLKPRCVHKINAHRSRHARTVRKRINFSGASERVCKRRGADQGI